LSVNSGRNCFNKSAPQGDDETVRIDLTADPVEAGRGIRPPQVPILGSQFSAVLPIFGDFCRFSPVGRLCTLGNFLKITEVAQTKVLTLTKMVLGYILGDFFLDSTSHPDFGRFFRRLIRVTLPGI
jgi:hypothetical protein